MGKVYTKHILRSLWKMVENIFFLDSEHVGIGEMLPLKNLLFLSSVRKQVQAAEIVPQFTPSSQRISLKFIHLKFNFHTYFLGK